ncbi:MAG: 4-hydroxy-tetrahydrodipicolinate synthase [Frankiaceae bacterium]|jgi:4-hydroxy-tetrahydrodipicolinate synthase|nr:4-hydroxy-tetrahydrodipicolinate synthase [Frankiaceae bacterium]
MRGTDSARPFGRLLTAMVTPFGPAGELDLDAAASLAAYLVDEQGNDGLVVNGTTGEAPTTSDEEKSELVRAVVAAVGDRAAVLAGAGTFDTAHSTRLAQEAQKAGADGLLLVTPYYSKPPQAGIVAHMRAVADAVDIPTMLYDIPHRSGVAISEESLIALAEHPRIVAVKDAKGDIASSSIVLSQSDLAYYSGEDKLTLPLLAIGAVGVVGTSTHVSGPGTKAMIEAFEAGDNPEALRLHRLLQPIYNGIFRTQGPILVKAALALRGRPVGGLRPPLLEATEAETAQLRLDLAASGLE